ncbi:pentatricopeptide repeat-containing protein At2g20710, mitochondrial-like [Solanum stenotomum]|uniref:pentatricopeptide repeat-containing protein At2g20710, mitochondrial-like n=1 Tax=Solanum stenotomum TaxID=172797 RepID=UPI0020D16983|nr:pentatricopeptide repeat-containing protein At2g20710, mitochondrial-like [Solanum stenotomum]XP_049385151.1 pentatricopeptide repeat-containing protein At2g20710, mitochondrial-like [Solanum stenotomum]
MKLSFSALWKQNPIHFQRTIINRFYGTTSTKQDKNQKRDWVFARIAPLGSPDVSMVPVLEQWVEEGKTVVKSELQWIIKRLNSYKRYKHALEVSHWMTDRRYFPLQPADVAARINLMNKVKGLEEVEKYFNSIPQILRRPEVYTALLNCYTNEKSVEKAEAIMQQLRDMGFAKGTLCYNHMMNLYYKTGTWEKMDNMMNEMEQKGVNFDEFTLTIRLTAYAAAGDSEGMDKILAIMESDKQIILHWDSYSIAAELYLKVGQVEKALELLSKLESMILTREKSNGAYNCLLKLYAEAGKKEEVHRVWDLYKQNMRILNKGYITVMSALMKFGDTEGVEKIFEEWELEALSYDFRVPDVLIRSYCRNGLLEKAKALMDKGISKGGVPWVTTWCHLANGYIHEDLVPEAVEALKKAISICPPNYKPSKETLATGVKYWEKQGNLDNAADFVRSLEQDHIFSPVFRDKLLCFIKEEKLQT